MPNWREVQEEILEVQEGGDSYPASSIRRKYLSQLSEYTGRSVIAYYSGFLLSPNSRGAAIIDDDMNGLMLCCHGLDKTKGLDLILHTSGGDLHAMESLVTYLKGVFDDEIRAIVPQIAMSAGTMIAVACKSIVMGKQSSLGPTDPRKNGIPAHAIKKQFEQAREEIISDPRVAPAWQPILNNFGVSFLKECDWLIQYAEDFVTRALQENMLKREPDASAKAEKIARALGDLEKNKSHGRRFHYKDCEDIGLTIEILESDQELQDLVLTVHHCYMHTMGTTEKILKIIENHKGHAWGKQLSSH